MKVVNSVGADKGQIYSTSPRPLSSNPTAGSNSKHYKTVPSHYGSNQQRPWHALGRDCASPASPFKLKSQVADKAKTSFRRRDTRQDSRLPTTYLVLCRVDVGTDGRDPLQGYFVGFSGELRRADHWGAPWVTTGYHAAPSELLLPLIYPVGASNLQDKKERCRLDAFLVFFETGRRGWMPSTIGMLPGNERIN
ncbi:hypothetical protein NC652_003716 [Populus alba x Populus x berolinensis]|nr:hypothetical protein NC652_003716 [Populus alba x Populus x berolinensis]